MSTQKMKSRGRESSGPAVSESAGEEVVDRLAGLLPAEALQDALAGLAPEEITGPGGLVTQLAGRVLEAALGAELTEHLLDLIYADSTPCAISFSDDVAERVAGVWHRPTVQAAARLDADRLCELEAALRDAGMIGAPIHAYGTLTAAGEWQARERWQAGRPQGAFGGPPRLARPYQRAGSVFARPQDRACPNCARMRRLADPPTDQTLGGSARTRRGRLLLLHCVVRWTIYLEPTDRAGAFDPRAEPAVCRPRWRYRGGWLHGDALAPPDHHPALAAA